MGGTPDFVPLAELKVDPPVMSAFLGRPVTTIADVIDFQLQAGYDFIRIRPRYDFLQRTRTTATEVEGQEGDASVKIAWAPEHAGQVRSRQDLDGFAFPTLDDADFSELAEAPRHLPAGMKIMSSVTGIFESVWQVMGFESFSIACAEDPDLVDDLFERFADFHFAVFEKAIDYPEVAGMWYTDDLAYISGPMVNPALLRRHVFPVMGRMGDMCRERDMPFVFHSDGDVTVLLEDIIAAGATALHPIEPKAMDALALKRSLRGRLALIGNIDVDLLSRADPDRIRRVTAEKIKTLGPDGYCVGSSNSVPGWVPVENYRAMVETAIEMRGA